MGGNCGGGGGGGGGGCGGGGADCDAGGGHVTVGKLTTFSFLQLSRYIITSSYPARIPCMLGGGLLGGGDGGGGGGGIFPPLAQASFIDSINSFGGPLTIDCWKNESVWSGGGGGGIGG